MIFEKRKERRSEIISDEFFKFHNHYGNSYEKSLKNVQEWMRKDVGG